MDRILRLTDRTMSANHACNLDFHLVKLLAFHATSPADMTLGKMKKQAQQHLDALPAIVTADYLHPTLHLCYSYKSADV